MTEIPPDHPGDQALRALSLGQLDEATLAEITAHLGDCPECCRRIDELASDDRLLSRLRQSAAGIQRVVITPAQQRSAVRALRQSQEPRSASAPLQPPPPAPHCPPRQVGDYQVLEEVGRGGMGVVYKARHQGLHRVAALKMVLAGEFASPTQELRFRLEAQLAARVRHPNIVQVYEIGSYEGRPYLALEWVEGGSLADRLDGKQWSPGEAAVLVETLARAIDVAHTQGVVHRDLKPANILVEGGAGWVVGQPLTPINPKIADFGLAQTLEGRETITNSGFLVGTPGYMAPEQAGGKRALVGPPTDIYALGVMLYQLLTGQLPFQRDSTLELLKAVTSDEPTRPRRLQPRIPRDLEAITLHCLEKEPSRRYPSALALAEDLERFRYGKQVFARPVGTVARLARACRRRPLVALLVVLLAASLFGGLGGVTWKWLEADEQRDVANQQRDLANAHAREAEAEKQAALSQAYLASLAAASAALENHDVADAARQLTSAPAALRGWEWQHLLSRLDDSSSVLPVAAGGGFLVPANDHLRLGILTDVGLRIIDLEGREERSVPLNPDAIKFANFALRDRYRRRRVNIFQTSCGLRVAAWTGTTAFELLDETGQVLCRVRPSVVQPSPIALSADGTRLAIVTSEGRDVALSIHDAASGERTGICHRTALTIWAFCFSPDGTRIVSCDEDKLARVWNTTTGELLATCLGHESKVLGAAFSPDGSRLATTSTDATVRQWDSHTGQQVEPPYDRHSGEVVAVTYSPDGEQVASAGTDRTVRVWRARGRRDVAVLHGHTGGVIEVAFSPDGHRLASLSGASGLVTAIDETIRVWDVDPQVSLPILGGHTSYVYPVAYSPDGRWLASGSWDHTVRLWDAATGELCTILPHESEVLALAFGPDGTWLMTGGATELRLRVWDVATARVRNGIPLPPGSLYSLTLPRDGKSVVASLGVPASPGTRMIMFDVASGKSLFSTEGGCLAYSPDGRWLTIRATDDKTMLLLDARTHETVARLNGHTESVVKADFSADSRFLASCSRDRTIRLWHIDAPFSSLDSPKCEVLAGHTDEVLAVVFHPDGKRLASAGRDGAIWLWDLSRREAVVRLPGHKSYVWSMAFDKDGTTLASSSGDGTVRLWDTAPLKTRYQARREAAALRPEAEQLVTRLSREKHDPADVVKIIRDDHSLSEAQRSAAIRAVQRRAALP